MATTTNIAYALVLSSLFQLLVVPVLSDATNALSKCGLKAIYQLGDSISDTGNLIRENPTSNYARLPYGSYLKKPTGRCSNGLLIIDYLARSARIPFLDPYLSLKTTSTRDHGVNFAVAGSTALPAQVLAAKNITNMVTQNSLSIQLDWMSSYFNRTCSKGCAKTLKSSLFMAGEIGGNDYNYALLFGKPVDGVKALVPEVVQSMKNAVVTVIGYGARRVVVPGNFPIGCFPVYLSQFQTKDAAAFDEFHCMKELNTLSMYHNELLKQAIEGLKKEYPDVIIVYGDYYNAFKSILQNAQSLGFDTKSVQKSCCGIGGDYNFSLMSMCGTPGVQVCQNPNTYISWDGVHLTQKAYSLMAKWLINDIVPKLQCSSA